LPEQKLLSIMNIDTNSLLDCAVSAVKEAGSHALRNHSRRKDILKVFEHDVKLKLDVECQAIAKHIIQSTFPEHAILGEEDTHELTKIPEERDNYQWIIDPIDGTVNFSNGLTNWCCSIGVRFNNKVVAGAVYIPVSDELFTATNDLPAMRNGSEIHVSNIRNLSESIVLTGLDKNNGTDAPPFEIFRKISLNTRKTRIMGSAAADLCQVACGRAEGYYESGIYIWDVAAAGLIVEKAGGKSEFITREADNRLSFLATNGEIHDSLRRLVPLVMQ